MANEFDVFLSHNSSDKPLVQEIATHLKARGISVWLDQDELRPGFPWQEDLEDGIVASRSVLVLFGPSDLGRWQKSEMRAFLDRAQTERIPVIPVLLPGSPPTKDLSLFLKERTWVDLRGGVSTEGIDRLVWGITGKKPGGSSSPTTFQPTPPPKKSPHGPWPPWEITNTTLAVLGLLVALAGLGSWAWFKKPDKYEIRVQTLDPDGRRISGAKVYASAGNEPHLLPDGWWEIEVSRAKVPLEGKVTITAEHPEWDSNQVAVVLKNDPNVQVEIRLKPLPPQAGKPSTDLPEETTGGPSASAGPPPSGSAPLQKGKPELYAVRVHILDPQGDPVQGGTVQAPAGELLQTDHGWEIQIPRAKLPQDGKITLFAEHPDWAPGETQLTLGSDSNLSVSIRLRPPESWIRGRVLDDNQRSLAGVQVLPVSGVPGKAISQADGRFEIRFPNPEGKRVRLRGELQGWISEEPFCITGSDICSIVLRRQ